MERVPERIGVAGDWHGNTAWASRAVRKISARLPADGPRIIVQLGDFGIWPGPSGREYLSRLDAALPAADAELWFVDGNHEDFAQLARLRPGPDGRAQVTADRQRPAQSGIPLDPLESRGHPSRGVDGPCLFGRAA